MSADPSVEMNTLLGSCVSACIWDPKAQVGGMNHFLLPHGANGKPGSERYGAYAMEILINDILKLGGAKSSLNAKIFGGASMDGKNGHIGVKNAEFALKFLEDERIPCVSKSIGGTQARRIRFVPSSGNAKQMFVGGHIEVPEPKKVQQPSSEIQFF